MAALTIPIRRARGYFSAARSDSLVRNSFYMMTSTVVTAGFGYIFWIAATHAFTSADVGIGGAVISLCTMIALFTYLGSWAVLVQRLHMYERSRTWTAILARVCLATAALTAVVAGVVVPLFGHSENYGSFFNSIWPVMIAVVGSAAWTLVNLLGAAFVAARRADRLLVIQALTSVLKLLLVVPLAAVGLGAGAIVGAWVGSAVLGVGAGTLWLVPRLRLGRARRGMTRHRTVGRSSSRRTRGRENKRPSYDRARHRQSLRLSVSSLGNLAGQHLTSVGGAATPLVLPVVVVLRLGVVPNAYFYITWMVGGAFFMVSTSVSNAVFAESVRAGSKLRDVTIKAFRVTAFLLIPMIVIMILGGKLILNIFGRSYGEEGYGLLILLAVSAIPDAVSNVAVAIFRVTNQLNYSAMLNVGILISTVIGAWFLMPSLGIDGAGAAWLGAQTLGAYASLPAFSNLGEGLSR